MNTQHGWVLGISNNPAFAGPYSRSVRRFFKLGYPILLSPYKGLKSKLEEPLKFISKYCSNDSLVMFTDAHDFIFVKPADDLFERFLELDCDILISTENRCVHHPAASEAYFNRQSSTEFRYLNGGMVIARSAPYKRVLRYFCGLPGFKQDGVNDQTFWGNLLSSNAPSLANIKLDYDRAFCHVVNNLTEIDPAPADPYSIHVTWQGNPLQKAKFNEVLTKFGFK